MKNQTATAAVVIAALSLLAAPTAAASPSLEVLPGFNAPVYALTAPDADGNIHLGGDFTAFNQFDTGGGTLTDPSTGATNSSFPKVEGNVNAAVGDGSGGWYVAGSFSKVDGSDIRNAAHVNADGSLDPGWNPSPDAPVHALAVADGVIYLGGDFKTVGGQTREAAAAVLSDGSLSDWNPSVESGIGTAGSVHAIAISATNIYLGGTFSMVSGQGRAGLAAVQTDGTLLPWNPSVNDTGGDINPTVAAIAVAGSTIYFGGSFNAVSGQARSNVAAIGATGTLKSWRPVVNGNVEAIAVSGTVVYIGGLFSRVANQPRSDLAAVSTGGALKPWNPDARLYGGTSWQTQFPVNTIAVSGSTIYVGGGFNQIGGESRDMTAAIGPDGKTIPWNPVTFADRQVVEFPETNVIAVSPSGIYVGGSFTQSGGEVRSHAAAIGPDGKLTDWAPDANDSVLTLLVSGSTIYMGGSFTRVSGQARGCAAAVTTDGSLLNWNPQANDAIDGLVASATNIFIGGGFTKLGKTSRNRLAAVSTDDTLQPWNPNVNGDILAMTSSGSTIYIGGSFTKVGTTARSAAAAITTGGSLRTWNPKPNTTNDPTGLPVEVHALSVVGSTVYMGGSFLKVGSVNRPLAAALTTAGKVLPWQPPIDLLADTTPSVDSIVADDSSVRLAGSFDLFGGASNSGLASSGIDGSALAWSPKLGSGRAISMVSAGSILYVAGDFKSVNGVARGAIAAFDSSGQLLDWGS
jgi:hypothetical protein